LLDEGADLLDLGAESTRPGSHAGSASAPSVPADAVSSEDAVGSEDAVSSEEEQARLLPVLEAILKARPEAIVSVDTYKAATAQAALAAGAEIVNDVSGFSWDAGLAAVCAQAGCGVVLMHTRGRPDEWAAQPPLAPDELLETISSGLQSSLDRAVAAGIAPESIVLDPGYGFGKRGNENFALLARQAELLALGRPLLAGLSRKSFLGHALAPLHAGKRAPVEARETASIAAMVAAILNGAAIVRVHQVRAAVEAALVVDAIRAQTNK
jgi:dihydropteroate synthase